MPFVLVDWTAGLRFWKPRTSVPDGVGGLGHLVADGQIEVDDLTRRHAEDL